MAECPHPDCPRARTSTPQPTVGRIVHYVGFEAHDFCEPRAAIVTAVPDLLSEQPNSGPEGYVKAAHLTVFDVDGTRVRKGVPHATTPTPGHWSWPPRA